MKIGILGGTFDPPHLGHLIIAEHVRDRLELAKVLFLPAVIPPHKQRRTDITSAEGRLDMLRRAVAGNPAFEVSDIEVRRGGISFTVDTLRELRLQYPSDAFFLLIGLDNVRDFSTWKEPELIKRMAHVVVMTRPGFRVDDVDKDALKSMTICNVPEIGISSHEIRNRVKEGHSIRYLVPPAVLDFIAENRLYQGS